MSKFAVDAGEYATTSEIVRDWQLKRERDAGMMRWEALVRYDEEMRAAAEKLVQFGHVWVDKLGEAFFALNENSSYLPNIVEKLVK